MPSRYRPLAVYSIALAALACAWLIHEWLAGPAFPPLWVSALCIAASLFIWQFGIYAPWVGLTSMERLPQIGLLLVLSPPVAATICAIASMLWPLLNRRYSHGSRTLAVVRSIHNSAMTALMLLLAGAAYEAVGGRHPLTNLQFADVWPLAVMAVVAQVANVACMALFYYFDGRDVRKLIKPEYSVMDLVFVPAGVLAAVLFNSAEPTTFALFVALMIVFVFSFNGIARTLMTAGVDENPLALLFRTGRALRGARRLDDLGTRILNETRSLLRFDEFYFALLDRDAQMLELRVHERNGQRLASRTKPLSVGLFGRVASDAQPLLIEDWRRAPAEARAVAEQTGKETGSLMIVPLIESGEVIGLLSVQHTLPNVYSAADLDIMQRLAEQVAAAVADARAFEELQDYRQRLEMRVAERTAELEQANREKERLIAALRERSSALERESREDALTGVANRRCFSQRLSAEIEVALALGQPLTLAVADLDRFKVVNDRLGHAIGDEALKQSANIMRSLCRENDLVARIGGEEFAIILPGMTREAAAAFCERVRSAVESHNWSAVHPHLRVTVSIGISQWAHDAQLSQLMEAADTQLYRAKNLGRNRVA
jgi:diguanylate cyclase (GGDEF)-like protein